MDKTVPDGAKLAKGAGRFLYYLVHLTWGLPVNLIGGLGYLLLYKSGRHERFCNAYITHIKKENFGGVSLGFFIFMAEGKGDNWTYNTRIHEYGHTFQCMLLGPLYWFVIGIPSFIWCNFLASYRKKKKLSYYTFYPEKWANAWGQKFSGLRMTKEDR